MKACTYNAFGSIMATVSVPGGIVYRQRIAGINFQLDPPRCVLVNGAEVIVPWTLLRYLSVGDEIAFPGFLGGSTETELLVLRRRAASRGDELFFASLASVGAPKKDARGVLSLLAEVRGKALGVHRIVLTSDAVRSYFYQTDGSQSFYGLLGVESHVSDAELRMAYKIRVLELKREGAGRTTHAAVERAFNILAHPDLRAGYDSWMRDPETTLSFPYGSIGSILVAGNRPPNGQTFFATEILSFLPDVQQRRFRAPLRRCEFYEGRALYRDPSRRVEVWLDPAMLHMSWTPEWNQWKRHLALKIEIQSSFVTRARYRKKADSWNKSLWETALPSRTNVRVPVNLAEQIDQARKKHQRFGKYAAAIEEIRAFLHRQPLERGDLQRTCEHYGIPGDFDVTQITWAPDYDPAFYKQLAHWSRRLYLFRSEYIFEMHKAIVVETPEVGHATYLFRKPASIDAILSRYITVTKQDIRQNKQNIAEQLGFIGRILHGQNPRAWLKELKRYLGEPLNTPDIIATSASADLFH